MSRAVIRMSAVNEMCLFVYSCDLIIPGPFLYVSTVEGRVASGGGFAPEPDETMQLCWLSSQAAAYVLVSKLKVWLKNVFEEILPGFFLETWLSQLASLKTRYSGTTV